MSALMARLRSRLCHPSYVDTLYRARCECGWTGAIREWEMDAQDDRSTHWNCVRQTAHFGSSGQPQGDQP